MTADQVIIKGFSEIPDTFPPEMIDNIQFSGARVRELMIEFAKLKTKDALRVASKKARTKTERNFDGYESSEPFEVVDRDSILSAYPESLIK